MTCSQENLSINSTYQIPHTYYRTFPQPSLILHLLRYGEYKILMTSQKIAKTFKNIQFQNLKNYSSEIFVADLHSASWEGVDISLTVNEACNVFKSTLINVIENHAPLQSRRVGAESLPWITFDIRPYSSREIDV